MTTPDTVLGYIATPPSARLLGWTLLDQDQERRWLKIGFQGRSEFANPGGFVQGGFLAAMLDDSMIPAVLLATQGRSLATTIDMNVSFLAPAKIGALVCEAQVVQLGATIGFVEGSLMDAGGAPVARATCTVRLLAREKVTG